MNNAVLIVIAHPDDEILGMGGTIQKLISTGKEISILLLSKPGNARNNNEGLERLSNFKSVMNNVGIKNIFLENYPDTSFDSVVLLDIIKDIEKVLSLIQPEVVYTHFYNDLNIDHCLTSKAVITALRPIKKFNFVKKILFFEILSSTELSIGLDKFIPNYYEDISKYIDKKKKLFEIYKTESRKGRDKKSIDIISKYRGIECGLDYAEAFMLYREII